MNKALNICDQCDRLHLASHSIQVGFFWLCYGCWASHPWNKNIG